ncbi:MAG TPA: hypothetical protein VKZ63_19935 [Kofleriaceae bacterium]|nr:hypothetical protein [Kofleriaceae bacterium]
MPTEDQKATELEASLSEDDRAFLDELADGIARRRLTAAALFFLESMKPMSLVGAHTLHFFRPIVQILWSNPERYDRLARLLERRGAIELLLRRLEARA